MFLDRQSGDVLCFLAKSENIFQSQIDNASLISLFYTFAIVKQIKYSFKCGGESLQDLENYLNFTIF